MSDYWNDFGSSSNNYSLDNNGSSGLSSSDYSWYDTSSKFPYSSSFVYSPYEFSSSSDLTAENPWYSDAWNYAKTQQGSSMIGGLASGAMKGYELMQAQDIADRTSKENKEYRDKQLELQERALEQGSEAAAAALAYQYAVLEDKIQTRAKHNQTINTAPSPISKVKIG